MFFLCTSLSQVCRRAHCKINQASEIYEGALPSNTFTARNKTRPLKRNYIEEILFTCWRIAQHKWTVEIVQSNLSEQNSSLSLYILCWYVEQCIASNFLDACQQIHNIGFFSRNYEHKTRWLTFLINVLLTSEWIAFQYNPLMDDQDFAWELEIFTSRISEQTEIGIHP